MKKAERDKSLKEIVKLMNEKADEQALAAFGEKGYEDYRKLTDLFDHSENHKDFVFIAGEMNAYLG